MNIDCIYFPIITGIILHCSRIKSCIQIIRDNKRWRATCTKVDIKSYCITIWIPSTPRKSCIYIYICCSICWWRAIWCVRWIINFCSKTPYRTCCWSTMIIISDNLPIVVFDITRPGNIRDVVLGKKIGTLVKKGWLRLKISFYLNVRKEWN